MNEHAWSPSWEFGAPIHEFLARKSLPTWPTHFVSPNLCSTTYTSTRLYLDVKHVDGGFYRLALPKLFVVMRSVGLYMSLWRIYTVFKGIYDPVVWPSKLVSPRARIPHVVFGLARDLFVGFRWKLLLSPIHQVWVQHTRLVNGIDGRFIPLSYRFDLVMRHTHQFVHFTRIYILHQTFHQFSDIRSPPGGPPGRVEEATNLGSPIGLKWQFQLQTRKDPPLWNPLQRRSEIPRW